MPGDELLGVEAFRLAELEEVIERGLSSFVEVGEALIEVQERRLYRRFGTFENYCSERWGLKRTRAYELMDASRVSEISDTPIEREGHAKQLRPLKDDPPALKAAAAAAVKVAESQGRDPIARDYREAREVTQRLREANEPVDADEIAVSITEEGPSLSAVAPIGAPLTIKQRRAEVRNLTERGLTTREISGRLGVTQSTVQKDLREDAPEYGPDGLTDRERALADEQVRKMNIFISMLEIRLSGEYADMDPVLARTASDEEKRRWDRVLGMAPAALRKLHQRLSELDNTKEKAA